VSLRDGKPRTRTADALPIDAASDPDAILRLKYVRALRGFPMTRFVLEPEIRRVWEDIGKPSDKPPGWSSVYRWVFSYKESDDNPLALVGNESNRGNRTPRFEREVIDICEEFIDNTFLTEERPSIAHVADLCRARVRKENKKRTLDGNVLPQLSMPSARLLGRLISDLPAFDVYRARYGRDAALKKFRNSSKVRIAECILHHAEIDHTRLDVFAVDDETGVPLGRPWLTVLIDVHSRCILGLHISYEPPSRATVAQCLRHAFMPKTYLRETHPGILNDWEAYGIPAGITMDGGLEFHSKELERIYFELNIEPTYAPRKTPWFKGKVERFQGTLNRGISASTPGKTFEGILDKAEYDPTKHAVLTSSEVEFVVHKWVVDVYHQKVHRALGCTPSREWRDSARTTDIPMVADPLRFDAIVAGSAERVLSHKGIEFLGLLYNSKEMGEVRRVYGDSLTVEVRFNRSDLGSVIVLHPDRGTPIQVPCLRPEYAEGLTEWQHQVCKKLARQRGYSDDVDGYLDALLEIHELVTADLKGRKAKGAGRDRVGRWRSGKSAPTKPGPKEAQSKVQASSPDKASGPVEDLENRNSPREPSNANTKASTAKSAKTSSKRPRFGVQIEDRGDSGEL